MLKRSRDGCIGCKRAKVKCDEIRPTCGTCARRGHLCNGYGARPLKWQKVNKTTSVVGRKRKRNRNTPTVLVLPDTGKCNKSVAGPPPSRPDEAKRAINFKQPNPVQWRTLSAFPAGVLSPTDERIISVYFHRHPPDMVMNEEGDFMHEMNANALLLLNHDPQVVSDTLCCIGQVYIQQSSNGSMVPALDRKGRALARLQKLANLKHSLEQTVLLLLGLCAMDLIDDKYEPGNSAIPLLHAYAAMRIRGHMNAGLEFSHLSKYFIRGLARQEMITALVHRRRNLIQTGVWLDEECRTSADRFMGLTVTLMPLLEELCALAEDLRACAADGRPFLSRGIGSGESEDVGITSLAFTPSNSHLDRAANLRARIESWRPVANRATSVRSQQKFLYQACAHRCAALLYLHRLFRPAGCSVEADQVALGIACEILPYLQALPEEIRTSLWPAFMAAAELDAREDRTAILRVFDNMYGSRKTTTTLRTKAFVVEMIWKARDTGQNWGWMALVDRHPYECLPI
ncbi:hypothetical protein A1O3_00662 [Capronia epimyces CBS 606.96]|uniref:Zn(2)-C6 fungal-type domain-containing protein n=1 Tax=Capronia epimyces CBS 606.96 TaxID=1182542 RepID=W9YGT6_9EURO|nr:uncharacterized protein A1O3_00662 [Capronia epimyces CBS 606.96]EXJ92112.1 hypothetical protein A1O3_00662 [Capronia epimyces CBS 606.96]